MTLMPTAVAWSSSAATIASVGADGWVVGVRGGSATITAQAGGRTATTTVSVDAAPTVEVGTRVTIYRSVIERPYLSVGTRAQLYRSVWERPHLEVGFPHVRVTR